MKNTYLWSYNGYSRSAKALATSLGIRRIKHNGSRYNGRTSDIIINWGGTVVPSGCRTDCVINLPSSVVDVRDKLRFFQKVSESCRCVPWTTDINVARQWNEKSTVVCRMSLISQGGHAILLVPPKGNVPTAPLYTKYIHKDAEYRVHIIDGEVIDVQKKIRDKTREPTNWKIRSHNNGFIYVRSGFSPEPDIISQSRLAFAASGLDFGAFDVVVKDNVAYVLECNSAPGLEGSSVENYKNDLEKLITKRREHEAGITYALST